MKKFLDCCKCLLSNYIGGATEPRSGESKKGIHMAQVVPIPNPVASRAVNLLATVGNTPLIRLEKITADLPGIEIYAKAEYFNPGGSVKDPAGLGMLPGGARTGRL